MNRCKTWAAALMMAWGATMAQAQTPAVASVPPALVTNGCGSGRVGFLVPDKTWLTQCQFEASCNAHDICYAKCLEGGALQGNPTCNVQADKQRRRAGCDASLQKDIIAANPGKPVCSMYASLYRFAVQALGESFFNGLVGGAAVEEPLTRFVQYLEKNPQDFDNAEIERAFDALATAGLQGSDYTVVFQPSGPRLQVLHQGQVVINLQGKTPGG
jgi:hypothetical protein